VNASAPWPLSAGVRTDTTVRLTSKSKPIVKLCYNVRAVTTPMLVRDDSAVLAHRDLVDEQLWHRLVSRIVNEHGVDTGYAERTMNQALGFLLLCAKDSSAAFSPSEAVDVGWHTFLMYTREYQEFCRRVAGGFIHHSPNDVDDAAEHDTCAADTVAAMRSYGIEVDEELWLTDGGECGGKKCYSCSGSQR
jgi:hypothetical protein